jgi:hypothetical protein
VTFEKKMCPPLGALALTLAIASSAAAQQPLVVTCDGPFGRNATRADVVKAFGADAVDEVVGGPEGAEFKATVLYPDDPGRRLEIIWEDEKKRRRPRIRITGKSTWTTQNGIRLDMDLAEIERRNDKPFSLFGFDWDYGGSVASWRAGALGKPQPGGCMLKLAFGIGDDAPGALVDKVLGDTEYLSSNPDMRAIAPVVFEITLSYRRP